MSDKQKTIIRASFPRVVFEDLPLDELVLDLKSNFEGTGIEYEKDRLIDIDQTNDRVLGEKGRYKFDYLVLATGVRHAYELIPGSYEHAYSICDPSRIMETKAVVQEFRKGNVYAGVGAGYTPCDGPPLEMVLSLDHRLRKIWRGLIVNTYTLKGLQGSPMISVCWYRHTEVSKTWKNLA
jgi:NADH dehydrogenase FAD-containing subunit